MPLSVGDKLGHYEVISLLGNGGMGEVYRARDTTLKRDVALKVLPATFLRDPDRMARFQREAQVLASLDHPNIGPIYGIADSEDSRGLVLALIEGPTLADRIAAGPLPQAEAIAIAKQIIEALEYAHDRGVIHRDLKPANVKTTPEGVVKVLDFGLAKVLEDEPPAASLANSPTLTVGHTRAGVILGTAAYMSPEQAVGRPVDRRSDIFSFGAVLFEMLTGKRAFEGETTPDVLEAVVKNDPDWSKLPVSTPASIQQILRRCLDKDRKQRLQAIGEARIVLANPMVEGATPVAVPLRSRLRMGGWIVAAVLASALAIALWAPRQAIPPATAVLRYTIPPPENTSVSSFSISADGRSLAVAARSGDKLSLWVRDLDSLQYRVLAGTEGADFPFWSPDGRSIGFFAGQGIKRVAASGGPVQTVLNRGNPFGGSWNRAGQILHQGPPVGGIASVPVSGGSETTLVSGKSPLFWPDWLPDGRRFVYSSTIGPDEQRGVYLGSLGSKDGMRLLPDASRAAYRLAGPGSRDGYLLFVREGALMAQPVNPETLRPTGDPLAIAEQLVSGLNGAHAFSMSGNGTLVYQAGEDATSDRRLTWFDRTGTDLGSAGKPGAIVDFSLSPEGTRVVVSRKGSQGTDLWIEDLERGTESRFTSNPSFNHQPVWAPDGARIVFSSTRSGRTDLYQKLTNGASQEELFYQDGGAKFGTDWSPDGKFILFMNNRGVYAVPLEDRKPLAVVQTGQHAQLSPDGRWLAYASRESGSLEVYVQPFHMGSSAPSGKWTISTAGGSNPRWRGDGKELFYLAADGKIMAVQVQSASGSKFAWGPPQPLFDVPPIASQLRFESFRYAVTADGKRFLVLTDPKNTPRPPLTLVINWQASLQK
jgi:Tol biopolymer transport system component